MLLMFSSFFIFLFISFILMVISFFISLKTPNSKEKKSPFECGFNPMLGMRKPFSLKFFLIGIIFLIFDIEAILIYPFLFNVFFSNKLFWLLSAILFMIILFWGLIHEWFLGSLNWKN